jgi:hypothetical protein
LALILPLEEWMCYQVLRVLTRSLTLRTARANANALALFSLYGRPQSRLVIYR